MDVRAAGRHDLPELTAVLARAFTDDPVMMWMFPRADTRTGKLRMMFGAVLRHHYLRAGSVEVAQTNGTIGGVAVWAPPGKWREPALASALMSVSMLRAFGRRLPTGLAVASLMKKEHPAEPHWYLLAIGTDPAVRGAGYGKAMLTAQLDRCDAEHSPAYLESSKESNVPYYERFGFAVTGEVAIPDGGPTLWKMWRDPR